MSFLFGDLEPSPFETNVLEILRDTIEFAAAIAAADQEIVTVGARSAALRAAADAEIARMDGLAHTMRGVLATTDQGEDASASAALASELALTFSERHQTAVSAVKAQLDEDVRRVEDGAVQALSRYRAALEAFLLTLEPPDSTWAAHLSLVERREPREHLAYEGEIVGRSGIGLDWTVARTIPDGSAWAKALRVDDVTDGLSIVTPQMSGLIKKAIKRKKQKLDRHFVTKLVDVGASLRVELRAELGDDAGFDLLVSFADQTVGAARTGDADDPTVGPFPIDDGDKSAIFELATKLRAAAAALPRERLVSATFDGAPFDGTDAAAQPMLLQIVPRIVARLAPIVKEIAARSRSHDELVLRRVLDDGHREEIFLPKSTLRDKLAGLTGRHRELFAPLALELPPPGERRTADEPPASIRSEVPPSAAPPAPAPSPSPALTPAPARPRRALSSHNTGPVWHPNAMKRATDEAPEPPPPGAEDDANEPEGS